MKKAILTKKAPLPIGPYNQAINYDNMLFVSVVSMVTGIPVERIAHG